MRTRCSGTPGSSALPCLSTSCSFCQDCPVLAARHVYSQTCPPQLRCRLREKPYSPSWAALRRPLCSVVPCVSAAGALGPRRAGTTSQRQPTHTRWGLSGRIDTCACGRGPVRTVEALGRSSPGEQAGFSCGSSSWSTRPFLDLGTPGPVVSFHLGFHFP